MAAALLASTTATTALVSEKPEERIAEVAAVL